MPSGYFVIHAFFVIRGFDNSFASLYLSFGFLSLALPLSMMKPTPVLLIIVAWFVMKVENIILEKNLTVDISSNDKSVTKQALA